MELTDTNRSIDLIVPITNVHLCCAKITLLRSRAQPSAGRPKVADARSRFKVRVKEQYQQKDIRLLEKLLRFADLVVIAERLHPIPFRTRP